jgi:ABC-2 type transport system permease protein/capsular polysaccharide transport system permease protein
MVDALPQTAQEIVLYIPMVHGTEFVREGYFGSRAKAHYDLGYVLPMCLAISALAMYQVRKVAARVVPG